MRLVRRARAEAAFLRAVARHPQTPRPAKWLAAGLAAYALSPIDLLPDFIPVLGQVDDVLVLALGIFILFRIVPRPVLKECRVRDTQVLRESV